MRLRMRTVVPAVTLMLGLPGNAYGQALTCGLPGVYVEITLPDGSGGWSKASGLAQFFTGVYAGVRLGQAAIKAGTYGVSGLWGTAQGRAFATVDAGRKAFNSGNAYAAASGTYVASTPGRVGSGLAARNINALDFIPGAATVRAMQNVMAACGGIF